MAEKMRILSMAMQSHRSHAVTKLNPWCLLPITSTSTSLGEWSSVLQNNTKLLQQPLTMAKDLEVLVVHFRELSEWINAGALCTRTIRDQVRIID